jgi:hypothetical protein
MKKTPANGTTTARPRRQATVPREVSISHEVSKPVDPDQISKLAYALWQARGGNGGSPEEDWYQAEQELLTRVSGNGR